MKKRKIALSVISVGDNTDFDSFKKLDREKKRFARSRVSYHSLSYKDLLSGNAPETKSDNLLFFFFFPFDYWNSRIETKRYRGVYGNEIFYRKFVTFFNSVDAVIKKQFAGRKIAFVNHPASSARCRDRLSVKKVLLKNGIPTPRVHAIKDVNKVYRYLSDNRSLFIKVRYGSMGKGITYVSPSTWKTNFVFRNKKILSRKSDYGWHFRDVVKREDFIGKLYQANVISEEAVDSLLVKGRKFDLRVYVFFGKVSFIYPRTNEPENITTNITQQGKGERSEFLKILPKRVISRVKKEALKTAESLGLNFAGIDIIIDKNLKDIYVLDVNVFPGFPKKKIFNLAKHIISELKHQATL